MTTAARIWNEQHADVPRSDSRMGQYERIIGQIATGVFILEPSDRRDIESLRVTFVNEMGAEFFGRIDGDGADVLVEAGH